jgi:HAD superfamily hydrolase (TIGR01450 family)
MDFGNIDTFVFDLDGTVWYWTRLIAGVKGTIRKLKKLGKTVLYVTNNTIESRKNLAKRLCNFGIETRYEDVVNAGVVIGYYIKEHDGTALALNVGTEKDLKEVGVPIRKRPPVNYVVVTEDWDFDYRQLSLAFDAVTAGGKLLTSVMGRHWLVGNKMVPGVGCWVKAVEFATNTTATTLGKPSDYMVKIVSKRLEDCKRTVYIGDEYESDVLFGQKLGCHTIFVNTGMDKNETSKIKPNLRLNMVKDLLEYI